MDYVSFKQHILALTGIDLNAYKESQMKRRIDALIKKNRCEGYQDYLGLIKKDRKQLDDFIAYLTINVSEFFRNPSQWDVLKKEIVPLLLQKNKKLKIWSAACATGDEPYSLAMILSKFISLDDIQILATDIDKDILAKAQKGEYEAKHLVNMPKEFKDRYFVVEKDKWVIAPQVKKCITFKQHDLLKDPYPAGTDLIVCRNVLIYFTEDAKEEIYKKFSKALNPGGVLFVGSTEQIISSQKYNLSPHRIFFYEKV